MPLPFRLAPEVTVTQVVLFTTAQLHEPPVDTVMLPLPPLAEKEALAGETV